MKNLLQNIINHLALQDFLLVLVATTFISLISGYGVPGVYVYHNVDNYYYEKFCRNGKYIEKYVGMYLRPEYVYGYWKRSGDTIIVDIISPQVKYSFDSLAQIEEKFIEKTDKTYFKVQMPDTTFGFNVIINDNKVYESNSDFLCTPHQTVNKFEIRNLYTWTAYKVEDTKNNFFSISFSSFGYVSNKDTLVDPVTKFLKMGQSLNPLSPYNSEPYYFRFKKVFYDKRKYYKNSGFCNKT